MYERIKILSNIDNGRRDANVEKSASLRQTSIAIIIQSAGLGELMHQSSLSKHFVSDYNYSLGG